jgi:hypothetical protein
MQDDRLPSDPQKRALEIADTIEAAESTGLPPGAFAKVVGDAVDEATRLVELSNGARLKLLIGRARLEYPDRWQDVAYMEAHDCLAADTAIFTWKSFERIGLRIREAAGPRRLRLEEPVVPQKDGKLFRRFKGNDLTLLDRLWSGKNVTIDELQAALHDVRLARHTNASLPTPKAVERAIEHLKAGLNKAFNDPIIKHLTGRIDIHKNGPTVFLEHLNR